MEVETQVSAERAFRRWVLRIHQPLWERNTELHTKEPERERDKEKEREREREKERDRE